MAKLHRKGWYVISDVLDEFGMSEQPIESRMVLVASMGNELRSDQTTYLAYEELCDLICDELKIVDWLGSWPKHIRKCLERYELTFFHDVNNCRLFYYNYLVAYKNVQILMVKETEIKLL